MTGRSKGFEEAHYFGASSGAFHWLPKQSCAASARTAGGRAAPRQSIDSRDQPPCRHSRGAAGRVPGACPSCRAAPTPVSEYGACVCIITRPADTLGQTGHFGGHGLVTSDVCAPGIPQSVATTL